MQISKEGIDLIKGFEGCQLAAYRDSNGVPTIGYGHTNGVSMGTAITQAQADTFLFDDLEQFETYVNDHVTIPLTQHQFDALVSFTYNLGPGTLYHSSVLTHTNAGQFYQAADAILQYDHAGGEKLLGLTRRREAERRLYLMPDDIAPTPPPDSLLKRFILWYTRV